MKTCRVTSIALFLCLVVTVRAGPETREAYNNATEPDYVRLEALRNGASSSKAEIFTLMSGLEKQWSTLSPEDKAFLAPRKWHDNRTAARLLAALGDDIGASEFLRKQVGFTKEYGMSPAGLDSRFEEFVLLQAGIAERTGSDPLKGMVDYLFRKQGDKYIIARQEIDPEVKDITVDGIKESETLLQVLEISAQNGQARIERTRWVIGPKGAIEQTLRGATREVSFDQSDRMSVKPLKARAFGYESKSPEAPASQIPATPAPAATARAGTSLASLPVPPVADNGVRLVDRKSPLWTWVFGLAAVAVIAFVVWRRKHGH
jgi:hypothetical protein